MKKKKKRVKRATSVQVSDYVSVKDFRLGRSQSGNKLIE